MADKPAPYRERSAQTEMLLTRVCATRWDTNVSSDVWVDLLEKAVQAAEDEWHRTRSERLEGVLERWRGDKETEKLRFHILRALSGEDYVDSHQLEGWVTIDVPMCLAGESQVKLTVDLERRTVRSNLPLGRALYSRLKRYWMEDDNAIRYMFPLVDVTQIGVADPTDGSMTYFDRFQTLVGWSFLCEGEGT